MTTTHHLQTTLYRLIFSVLFFNLYLVCLNAQPGSPPAIFGELFTDMHESGLWADGKSISDATPLSEPTKILAKYRAQKSAKDFDLMAFFEANFDAAVSPSSGFKADTSRSVTEHIELLWDVLRREADVPVAGSSRIPLPNAYIVPGGRFNEIYYWDSYFTMLGLQVSGRVDMIENMVDNFSYLIDEVGFIPNGNRSYFLGRSQPPFYAMMVEVLAEEKGEKTLVRYLPQLLKEHQFWMGDEHTVKLKRGTLNRYQDKYPQPRAEMYMDDIELSKRATIPAEELYSNLRAACESGWDFSSRWMDDPKDLATIRTSEILPVDLNCLLWQLETTIAKASRLNGEKRQARLFQSFANKRKKLILKTFWSSETGYFHDYNFVKKERTERYALAGMYPLFFNLAKQKQAQSCAKVVREKFLHDGGLVTTPINSGQQWDAPNGWAPLQWMSVKGFLNYDKNELATTAATRWLTLNEQVYKRTGKMLEKYNVMNTNLLSGGGEYPVQDGFGWTNGVYLKLKSVLKRE